MHESKGISAEAYLDWPIITVFQIEIMCSGCDFTCVSQNEAMTSVHGGVPGKEHESNKMSEM